MPFEALKGDGGLRDTRAVALVSVARDRRTLARCARVCARGLGDTRAVALVSVFQGTGGHSRGGARVRDAGWCRSAKQFRVQFPLLAFLLF